MLVLNKRGFKLPRLEKEKFVDLVRGGGVGYQNGFFFVKNYNNEKILSTLSDVLEDSVGFTQTCTICRKEFPCGDCKYYGLCPTRDLPLHCLCQNCRLEPDSYERYISKNASGAGK